jgi:hypothetical protein
LASDERFEEALPLFEQAASGNPPTCDFSGEWIRSVHRQAGGGAAVEVARTVWEKRCATAPGVRGAWAHALLDTGDIRAARRILTPPPQLCDRTLAVPVIALATIDDDHTTRNRCEIQMGKQISSLLPEVEALVTALRPVPAEPPPVEDSTHE